MNQGVYYNKKYKFKINTQQNEYFLNHLEEIILHIKPHRIIEIGTARGGTTLLLSDILHNHNLNSCKIKTFDISMRNHLKRVDEDNIDFYVGNIFKYKNQSLIHPKEITEFISNDKVNLFLCDGGNKIKEFLCLCPYLNKGDVIMLHDYAPNKQVFDSQYKDKIWNWMEVSDSDISNAINKFKLKHYKMDLIKPSAWIALLKYE